MIQLIRTLLTGVNLALVGALANYVFPFQPTITHMRKLPTVPWAPPTWFPEADQLWELQAVDGAPVSVRAPKIRSKSVIIADLDSGEVLYAKDPDGIRPVASMTKVITSLTWASTSPDPSKELCVDHRVYPLAPGARSKFETGVCHEGWDFLGAALVASDNRGAMGLAAHTGLELNEFVDQMNVVSGELGLNNSHWADPTGLLDDNLSTARDLLKGLIAVSKHPLLSVPASSRQWQIQRKKGPQTLGTTNRLIVAWNTLAAKTGYTDTAKYCYGTVVETRKGRRLGVVVLGAPNSQSRFDDAHKLLTWASNR